VAAVLDLLFTMEAPPCKCWWKRVTANFVWLFDLAEVCALLSFCSFCCSQETATMTMTADDLSVLRTARMHRVMNKLKSVSVSNVVILPVWRMTCTFVCYYGKFSVTK